MNAKIAIIDPGYRDPQYLGLGATWLRWAVETAGSELVSEPSQADWVLMSVQSQQSRPQVVSAIRRCGIRKGAHIVLGGPGCYGPAVFDDIASVCCVGEGSRFLQVLLADGIEAAKELPNAWVPGQTREVVPDNDFPWDLPPIMFQDGFARVWASRGCKRRCLFCQTGWERAYRENPNFGSIVKQAADLNGAGIPVCVATNDAAELDWSQLPAAVHFSATFAGLERFLQSGNSLRGRVRSVRIGVEGCSERLRRAVGKPVDGEALVGLSRYVLEQGVGVTWFFICGLPGEDERDYEELRGLVSLVKRRIGHGVVMMRFHAFIPQPAAPLSVIPLTDGYWERFDEFRRWFFHGPGLSSRVQLVAPSRPPHRLKDAQLSMGCTTQDLRRGWFNHENRNWRVQYRGSVQLRRRLALKYLSGMEASAATAQNSTWQTV